MKNQGRDDDLARRYAEQQARQLIESRKRHAARMAKRLAPYKKKVPKSAEDFEAVARAEAKRERRRNRNLLHTPNSLAKAA